MFIAKSGVLRRTFEILFRNSEKSLLLVAGTYSNANGERDSRRVLLVAPFDR